MSRERMHRPAAQELEPRSGSARGQDEAGSGSRVAALLRLAAVAVVLLLLALLAWATLAASRGSNLVEEIAAGDKPPAPAFSLPVLWRRSRTWPPQARRGLTDGRLRLGELRGRPVVLNFWASWCIPCREEAPILNASARVHRGGVAFLGIDVQDLKGDALSFLREFDVAYPSVRDPDNSTFDDYGLTGVPETYVVDGRERIVTHSPGPVTRNSLEAAIRRVAGREG